MKTHILCLGDSNTHGYCADPKDNADGGINGYFLDSEPENWNSLYPTVSTEPLTAETLLSKSVSLANTAKKIDPTALIYGPSTNAATMYARTSKPQKALLLQNVNNF